MSRDVALAVPIRAVTPARAFAAGALVLAGAAALLAGWAPLGFSIVTVFLFAGPHNWLELRYFLTRTPARWGRLRSFFLVAFGGVLILAGSFAGLTGLLSVFHAVREVWWTALSLWNSAFMIWLAVLVWLRSRQKPRRDWSWVLPLAPLLIAAAWAFPAGFGLPLVYLHPLV